MNASFFCSVESREAGEQLFGTATRVDYWFALEYPAPFGRKAFEESELPGAVKSRLAEVVDSVPNGRIQMIKKGPAFARDGEICFFIGVNHEETPHLYEFQLSRYEDLLDLDLAGILAEARRYWDCEREAPLFLVCTNARRDQCCAKFGLPICHAMAAYAAGSTWRSSHLGGHRFAPTMVCLPHGAGYGRLKPGDVSEVIDAYRGGQVHLPNYRGRSCYSKLVQAAETFLRRETGELALDRYKLVEVETLAEARWMVHFTERTRPRTHCVQLRSETPSFALYKSCGMDEPERLSQYRLEVYRQMGGMAIT